MKIVVVGCIYVGMVVVKNMVEFYSEVKIIVYEWNDNVLFLFCGIVFYVGGVVKDVKGLFYFLLFEL